MRREKQIKFNVRTRREMDDIAEGLISRGFKVFGDTFYVLLLQRRNTIAVIEM